MTNDQRGLSLIELIVAMTVSLLVLTGVGTVLINAWLAQEDVTTTSEATTRGQLIGSSIEKAMRNALGFKVAGSGGTELWVWTSLGGARSCQGFRLAPGESLMSEGAGPLGASSSWASWEQDVVQRSGGAGPVAVFAETVPGKTVTYTFDIRTESAPVRFNGEASVRSTPGAEADNPCW
ncbi:prepilin-type N-terminal cleavage/methylation domain-containing protein [Microbacterium jejuense]|uniref:Prepilin-type N-terminal cleavage/methylation domain-containing protein n=1 Tax=Microbacterium jejuense TaxID=1263637 RepID=A0ABS7HM94_9MICO|nr:prepilin-type N-terminal cleavage/methylation domain-containing protein [Microbacterium jejuense]MBW9094081.1 prepilin-type N-terminal cleavage/methylation domain-containing protein [Microbacterium jejuense]